MKNLKVRVLAALLMVIICFLFATHGWLWTESMEEQLSTISIEDIQVTVVDEDTVSLENLIKGDDLLYSWTVTNSVEGVVLQSVERLEVVDRDVIEFTYETLENIAFVAVVSYDGHIYASDEFCMDMDGNLSIAEDGAAASVETAETITRNISDIVSLAYLCFLGVIVLIYYISPKGRQWLVLLGASLVFYCLSGVQYIIFIILSAYITFVASKIMSARRQTADAAMATAKDMKEKKQIKADLQNSNKNVLYIALICTLGVMAVIKYSSFVVSNINAVLGLEFELVSLVMPLGLSFYTFMLIAYLLDVYRGKYLAEEKFSRFFLFISFFPHVSQGPLSRYDEVSPQLQTYHRFDYDNVCLAAQRILWGFFVKLIIADRIALLANGVYDNYSTQSWLMLIIGSVAYSVQIYADFYSSMEIAIGSAQMFGIRLQENFMRPYFATSMPEFWRRWHATLGTWFKEYVFYPISISKRVMKFSVNTRKRFGPNVARVVAAAPPIMAVWILTGLWHGAMWKFVAWGIFHGILILLSTAFTLEVQKGLQKIGIRTESGDYKVLQMIKVFILCMIGRVFFRADSIYEAITIFKRIFTGATGTGLVDFSAISMDLEDGILLAISIMLLLTVSIIQETRGSVRELIMKANIWVRWAVWIFLIFAVLLYGMYGPGTAPIFIYESF